MDAFADTPAPERNIAPATLFGPSDPPANDPGQVPPLHPSVKSQEDLDTCRICRGEGTPEEPLFYPCKCSGSIKYVHQDCLMEWLSHSQKKHCELCKTSFRFTKLYHPQMPQNLPNSVFVRKAAIHFLKALVGWCRGILVISVWTLWLPWSMRFVWWGLFWIGDGGWTKNLEILRETWDAEEAVRSASKAGAFNGTRVRSLPASPHMLQLPLIKQMLSLFGYGNTTSDAVFVKANITSQNLALRGTQIPRNNSLLSDIAFFRELTPSTSINNFILDTVEGQIITLSVVTGFVLVFLIREWVVQQQPALNLGALNDDAVNDGLAVNQAHEPPEAEEGDRQASTTVLEQEAEDELDLDMETIDNLIKDLSEKQEALTYLAQEEFSEWHGNDADLNIAKDAVLRTQRAYFTLKKHSKRAIDTDNRNEAKSALDRLNRLQGALKYLPWKDETELVEIIDTLQAYIDSAYRLLELQSDSSHTDQTQPLQSESGRSLRSEDDDDHMPEIGTEPLLNDEQIMDSDGSFTPWQASGTSMAASVYRPANVLGPGERHLDAPRQAIAHLDVDSHSALTEIGPSVRPAMPTRTQSSRAAEIRRDLEESLEHMASPAHYQHVVSNSLSNREDSLQSTASAIADNSQNSTIDDDAESSSTPLRRKQKIETLSAEYRQSAPDGIGNEISFPAEEDARASISSTSAENMLRPNDETIFNGLISEPNRVDGGAHSMDPVPNNSSGTQLNADADTGPESGMGPPRPATFAERLLDWIYGDLIPAGPIPNPEENDEQIVREVAAEAPFVPFNDAQVVEQVRHEEGAAEANQEVNAADAAAQAAVNANDADAIDDAEDLEGILELVGLRGNLANLFQNAVFAAVLVSATVASAILFPYLCGKLSLLILANPIRSLNIPMQVVLGATNFAIDFGLVVGGTIFWAIDWPVELMLSPIELIAPAWSRSLRSRSLGKIARSIADSAAHRIIKSAFKSGEPSGPSSIHLNSHIALRALVGHAKATAGMIKLSVVQSFLYLVGLPTLPLKSLRNDLLLGLEACLEFLANDIRRSISLLSKIPSFLRSGAPLLTVSAKSFSSDGAYVAEEWTISDRMIAIATGYALFAIAGALYISRSSPFASSDQGKKVENIIRDIFQQSAGVVKVILIIGIEMLVFPLYCGLLLDMAMLPLFEQSTLQSRLEFTLHSPWTSAFFHWFIGTCYMFHFALFVSMCRKIFRKGVLYFIRDPDDPNFHPVRDVLERSVSSQLRKIAFSALVYGALVILCMGSVVWAVGLGLSGVFPVKWTAPGSYLGYPVDLLLYNFLAPLALHLLRPSKGLHAVYEWWFRKSARLLRLSHFLFNEVRDDEGGTDLNDDNFYGAFVRAPASDSVRIPRGHRVFLEVDENDVPVNGQPDPKGRDEVHGRNNEEFAKVWIPPWFQLRIGIFVFLLWALTAILGLSVTVAPLLLGREAIKVVFGGKVPPNDLYSYFVGACPLVLAFYSKTAVVKGWKYAIETIRLDQSALISASKFAKDFIFRSLRVIYTYTALVLFVPTLLALLLECYLILPLQTYAMYQQRSAAPHTVYLLQDWTLGLMYLRILMRLLLWDSESRASRALYAIVARGWSDPDVRIVNRCFLLPITIGAVLALCGPSGVAYFLGKAMPSLAKVGGLDEIFPQLQPAMIETVRVHLIRFSYPLTLALFLGAWSLWLLKRAAGNWRLRIRDEIYLIGERLHNFGDRRPGQAPATAK